MYTKYNHRKDGRKCGRKTERTTVKRGRNKETKKKWGRLGYRKKEKEETEKLTSQKKKKLLPNDIQALHFSQQK